MRNIPNAILILSIVVLGIGFIRSVRGGTPPIDVFQLAQTVQYTEHSNVTSNLQKFATRTNFSIDSHNGGFTSKYIQANTSSPEYKQCPIVSDDGRTIVDFTNNGTIPTYKLVLPVATEMDAKDFERAVNLPSGTYRLESVSYAIARIEGTLPLKHIEPQQRWYAEILDGNSILIEETPTIRDVLPGEVVHETLTDTLVLPGGTYTISVRSVKGVSNIEQRDVIPLCFSLVRIDDAGNREIPPVEFQ